MTLILILNFECIFIYVPVISKTLSFFVKFGWINTIFLSQFTIGLEMGSIDVNFTLELLFAENISTTQTTMNFSSSTSATSSTLSTVTTSEEDSSSTSSNGPQIIPKENPDEPLHKPTHRSLMDTKQTPTDPKHTPMDPKQTPTDPKQTPNTGQTVNKTIVHLPPAIEIDGSGVNPE